MKKLFILSILSLALISCSSPQRIILKDGNTIETKDDPKFNKKTNYFEYVDKDGSKGRVNADMVEMIQPEDAKIPEKKAVAPAAPIVPVVVPVTSEVAPVEAPAKEVTPEAVPAEAPVEEVVPTED